MNCRDALNKTFTIKPLLAGGVKILIKVLHSIVIDESKLSVLQVLINVIEKSKIQEQLIECDGIPMLLKLVMSKYDIVVQYSATVKLCYSVIIIILHGSFKSNARHYSLLSSFAKI